MTHQRATRAVTLQLNTGASAGLLTLSGVVSESSTGVLSLSKTGAGPATLSGANTFTGQVTVSAGTLNANSATALGANVSSVTVASGATLSLGVAPSYTNKLLTLNGNGVTSTTGALVLDCLTAGFNSITQASPSYIRGISATPALTTSIGGAFLLTVGASSSTTLTMAGAIATGAGGLTIGKSAATDTGTVVLIGTNTYTGTTTLASGTAQANVLQDGTTSGPFGASGAINMTGGTLQYAFFNQTDYSSRLGTNANGQWRIDTNGQTVTFAFVLSGASSVLTKLGTGTLRLVNSNTYSGGTNINAGTLSFVSGGLGSSGTISMGGGTLQYASGNTQDISARLTLTAATTATFDVGSNVVQFNTAFGNSASATVVKQGSGTLTLWQANTYTGGTTISTGTVFAGNESALGTGSVTLANGTTLQTATGTTQKGKLSVGGNLTNSAGGTIRIGGE